MCPPSLCLSLSSYLCLYFCRARARALPPRTHACMHTNAGSTDKTNLISLIESLHGIFEEVVFRLLRLALLLTRHLLLPPKPSILKHGAHVLCHCLFFIEAIAQQKKMSGKDTGLDAAARRGCGTDASRQADRLHRVFQTVGALTLNAMLGASTTRSLLTCIKRLAVCSRRAVCLRRVRAYS